MKDFFLQKMAEILVGYSLNIKKGDKVLMEGDPLALPLMEALYVELMRRGAHIKTSLLPSRWKEHFFAIASKEQLTHVCPFSLYEAQHCDKRIRIIAPENTRNLMSVDPHKQALFSRAQYALISQYMQRSAKGDLRWVIAPYPTLAAAQEADMGILEYEAFILKSCFLDQPDPSSCWQNLEKQQEEMIAYLSSKKELHFQTGKGTDLKVNVEGMRWKNCCGKINFPDGEVFTGPHLKAKDGGVNGTVAFTYPAIWKGNEVEGVQLTFAHGKVVEAKATKNEPFLKAMLAQDAGASYVGEIAIGTNYHIERFTKEILFDEKMGGTFHLALGMGYPETGNTNQSALHWDMICDLREGGTISADGEIISKEGKFVFSQWPH